MELTKEEEQPNNKIDAKFNTEIEDWLHLCSIHHSSIPDQAIYKNIAKIVSTNVVAPRLAVLLTTGSYYPVHLMHVEILKKAKNFLEDKGYHVVGGFISPTHDQYVGKKMEKNGIHGISAEDRLNMVRLVTKDYYDWLLPSSWELNQPFFYDFPDVFEAFSRTLKYSFVSYPLDLFYVCGADHSQHVPDTINTIVVARPGSTPHQKKFVYIPEETTQDLSSTSVRKMMIEFQHLPKEEYRKKLEPHVGSNVAYYIISRGIKVNVKI